MINKYPDGSSYAKIKLAGEYQIPIVNSFTYRLNSYEDLWHLNQIVDVYTHLGVRPTITIPNIIDGQADRRFNMDESSGLKLVCKFLNNMRADFKIFHPHNAEVVESLIDNVEIIDNSNFIKDIIFEHHNGISGLNDYSNIEVQEKLIILLPDGGAYKWGVKLVDSIGWKGGATAAAKNRKLIDGKSILTQQLPDYNFEGKDILIIDDICINGGTFKGLASMLRERNCGKLYLAVSHITIQNHNKDNVFQYFDKVFTTNSKYSEYYERVDGSAGREIKNLEVVKLF
jgi:ribose-phosphate pyrophosphokinase